ncbi:MAG: hypothetical protein ACYCZ0_02960 [Minisyncoccota bacterium]
MNDTEWFEYVFSLAIIAIGLYDLFNKGTVRLFFASIYEVIYKKSGIPMFELWANSLRNPPRIYFFLMRFGGFVFVFGGVLMILGQLGFV